MKKIMVIIGLIVCQAAMAQHRDAEISMQERFDHLDSVLQLNEMQKQNIEKIMLNQKVRMQELKTQDSLIKVEMHELRKQTREAIKAELTPEQTKLMKDAMGKHHRSKIDHRGGRTGHHKGMDALKGKRAAFDSLLNEEEKQIIEDTRVKMKAMRDEFDAKDSLTMQDRMEMKKKRDEILKSLEPIKEKYKAELKDVTPVHESAEHPRPHRGKMNKEKEEMREYRFLLMKP